MLNPHHVEAMVYERQRELRATAASVHRGAAARRSSSFWSRRRAGAGPSRRVAITQWLSRLSATRRRRQPDLRPDHRPNGQLPAPGVALARDGDGSAGGGGSTGARSSAERRAARAARGDVLAA